MSADSARIKGIYRYPVKGLSPEPMARVELLPSRTVPFDRAYAIENGPTGFDPANPKYFPKIRFLMLMKNARLAELRTAFDETGQVLSVRHEKREVARGDLRTAEGCASIQDFFAEFCADELRGPPRV